MQGRGTRAYRLDSLLACASVSRALRPADPRMMRRSHGVPYFVLRRCRTFPGVRRSMSRALENRSHNGAHRTFIRKQLSHRKHAAA
jgi:hypothetical protein